MMDVPAAVVCTRFGVGVIEDVLTANWFEMTSTSITELTLMFQIK